MVLWLLWSSSGICIYCIYKSHGGIISSLKRSPLDQKVDVLIPMYNPQCFCDSFPTASIQETALIELVYHKSWKEVLYNACFQLFCKSYIHMLKCKSQKNTDIQCVHNVECERLDVAYNIPFSFFMATITTIAAWVSDKWVTSTFGTKGNTVGITMFSFPNPSSSSLAASPLLPEGWKCWLFYQKVT